MSEYEPGTVAVATVHGVPNVRVFRYSTLVWVSSRPVSSLSFHSNQGVTDVRPLVVLDLADMPLGDDEFGVAEMVRSLREEETLTGSWLADQIEAQTKPPKPPKPAEPTGLGAVVEDADGRRWVLCPDGYAAEPWRGLARGQRSWSRIDAVRVLSEGVTNG